MSKKATTSATKRRASAPKTFTKLAKQEKDQIRDCVKQARGHDVASKATRIEMVGSLCRPYAKADGTVPHGLFTEVATVATDLVQTAMHGCPEARKGWSAQMIGRYWAAFQWFKVNRQGKLPGLDDAKGNAVLTAILKHGTGKAFEDTLADIEDGPLVPKKANGGRTPSELFDLRLTRLHDTLTLLVDQAKSGKVPKAFDRIQSVIRQHVNGTQPLKEKVA